MTPTEKPSRCVLFGFFGRLIIGPKGKNQGAEVLIEIGPVGSRTKVVMVAPSAGFSNGLANCCCALTGRPKLMISWSVGLIRVIPLSGSGATRIAMLEGSGGRVKGM